MSDTTTRDEFLVNLAESLSRWSRLARARAGEAAASDGGSDDGQVAKLTARIPRAQREQLERRSRATGQSISDIVREALVLHEQLLRDQAGDSAA